MTRTILRPPRMSRRALSAVLALAALAAVNGCSRRAPVSESASAPDAAAGEVRIDPQSPKLAYIGVDTVGARRQRVVAVLPAQVAMDEDRTVRMSSPVVGRIVGLGAQIGDVVTRGQVLARIASGDLAQAASDLVKAEATAKQTSEALARSEDLYQHRAIALKDLEQARSEEAQAQAERKRAELRLRQLGGQGGEIEGEFALRAPFRGTVVDRNVNSGSEVRNDNGQVLFTISALDTVWIAASAYPRDLPVVKPGEDLEFSTDAAPGRRFTARVLRVSSALEPQTHTATVIAQIPNPDGVLRPQLFGEARVLARDEGRDLVISTTALVTRGHDTVVFVQRGPGDFVSRPVQVRHDDGVTAVIADGLKPGERVVTRGSLLLSGELR